MVGFVLDDQVGRGKAIQSKNNRLNAANLAEMIRVAETLASHFSFIRVDMYSDGQACFVGELTNCPGNASRSFMPADGELRASQILFGNSDGQTSSGQ